jgi:hypothetical protein
MAACAPFGIHFARKTPFGVGLETLLFHFLLSCCLSDRFGQCGRPSILRGFAVYKNGLFILHRSLDASSLPLSFSEKPIVGSDPHVATS